MESVASPSVCRAAKIIFCQEYEDYKQREGLVTAFPNCYRTLALTPPQLTDALEVDSEEGPASEYCRGLNLNAAPSLNSATTHCAGAATQRKAGGAGNAINNWGAGDAINN